MKKIIPFILTILCLSGSSFVIDTNKQVSLNNVVVRFMTTNLRSNNLYIDNFSIGTKFDYDIASLSINNISIDTSYATNGNNPFTIAPRVSFLNAGKFNITSAFNVTLQVTPGNYTSSKQISSLGNHRAIEIIFDSITIAPGTQYIIKTWSSLESDQNRLNDTINKISFYLPGTRRNVLFESFTNVSCTPCGINNPYLYAFIASRFDTIIAIQYHTWWPAQNDPMFTHNPLQINNRINYYPINNVPVLNVDGKYLNIYPYTRLTNLLEPYKARLSNGAPLGISVTDTRIAPDTISSAITLNIYSPLPQGNYRMKLNAIERYIHFQTPPGLNPELDFYDVFRRMYPDTNGILIPATPGVYNYNIKYVKNPVWVDSMIYSSVYVQNDVTKEIINCAKSRHVIDYPDKKNMELYSGLFSRYTNKVFSKEIKINGPTQDTLSAGFYFDAFENEFPPANWQITNTDNINFSQSNIASGPSFGGSKSIVILLQSAQGNNASYHYLKSKVFNNINLTDSIKFDWAFAPYGVETVEGLKVEVSTDGGNTFEHTIFNRTGNLLATAENTSEAFVPADSSQWRTFSISVSALIGIKQISENVPKSFALYQNYPNPFNPTTKIRFDVPPSKGESTYGARGMIVQLKIYDALGREVAILVNEQLNPGTYEVEWNGTNYPSGVYFYKLETSDYTQTRKLVLLK